MTSNKNNSASMFVVTEQSLESENYSQSIETEMKLNALRFREVVFKTFLTENPNKEIF